MEERTLGTQARYELMLRGAGFAVRHMKSLEPVLIGNMVNTVRIMLQLLLIDEISAPASRPV